MTDIHSYITFIKSTGKNSLADLARDLERAVLFLKHLGRDRRVTQRSHKNLSLSLVLLGLRLPHPVAPTPSLLLLWSLSDTLKDTGTHSRQHSSSPSQTG